MLEYGARYDQDNYFSTVIDKENVAATTKGILDGNPVEFSGGSGGEEMFIITADKPTENTASPVTCDKTLTEVVEAIESGAIPLVKFLNTSNPMGDQYYFAHLEAITESSGNVVNLRFIFESKSIGVFDGYCFIINDNNTLGFSYN